MGYRVIQWATGGVGRGAIDAIATHPELELVGCWVHSADKVGCDADGKLLALRARIDGRAPLRAAPDPAYRRVPGQDFGGHASPAPLDHP